MGNLDPLRTITKAVITLIPYHHLLLPTSPWLAQLTATTQVSQVRKLRRGELEWIIQE